VFNTLAGGQQASQWCAGKAHWGCVAPAHRSLQVGVCLYRYTDRPCTRVGMSASRPLTPRVGYQDWLSGLAIRIAIDRGGVSEVEGGACATSATILASCRSAGLSAILRPEDGKDGHVIGKSQSLSVLMQGA
jgi:hypothetical protein